MKQVSVWAPKARRMTIIAGGWERPMTSGQDGWWTTAVTDEFSEYAFSVDGEAPLPDPRSGWQPYGVHGPSRIVDHSDFRWTDGDWGAPALDSAVFYELHIGTFTPEGTFDSAIERLPYLKELGITHVELMPVAQFGGLWGWGYDGVDLYAPHHPYGGPTGLKRLVNAMHGNGLAAVLDVVYNHLGPAGNYLSRYGPYFTNRYDTPWGEAVNLSEEGCREVRRFLLENAAMWLRDYHFDGLRLDAIHALIDASEPHFLEEIVSRVRALESELRRPLSVIAESDLNDPRIVRPREHGGYGLDAQWSDDFHHALHALLTGERDGYYSDFGSMKDLAKAIEAGFVYDGSYSEYRSRSHGKPLDRGLRRKLVTFIQNHDQVGNRARGGRIAALAGADRAKIGAAVTLLSPYIPLLFQGEEWAASTPFQYFTSHEDPSLGAAISEGRRREFIKFGWSSESVPDPQDPDTFRRSKLNWDEVAQPEHADMLSWYRSLIALRSAVAKELRGAAARARFDEAEGWFIVECGPVMVAFNLSASTRRIPIAQGSELLISSGATKRDSESGITLSPDGVAVLGAAGNEAVAEFLRKSRVKAARTSVAP